MIYQHHAFSVPRSIFDNPYRTFWSSRGRPEDVLRRHFGALARQFSGGCLSRFAAFRFFMFLVYHVYDQNRQPLSQIGVFLALLFFLGAPRPCAGAAFYVFFVLRVFVACCFLMTPVADPLLFYLDMSLRNQFRLRRRSVL